LLAVSSVLLVPSPMPSKEKTHIY